MPLELIGNDAVTGVEVSLVENFKLVQIRGYIYIILWKFTIAECSAMEKSYSYETEHFIRAEDKWKEIKYKKEGYRG
jgi:hypothetical protein